MAYNLPGGDRTLNDVISTRKGVFANHPAMTPKYHTGNRDASLEYMARFFIPFSEKGARDSFIASFGDGPAAALARSLATLGDSSDTVSSPDNYGTYGLGYIDFLLQSAMESFQEKAQIVDVLSDNYVTYMFGQAPPIFTYTGKLINSRQDDWRAAFTVMYQDIIRGTKLARKKLTVTLAYDNVFVTGILLNNIQTLRATDELAADFRFQMLVKRYSVHSRSGSVFIPTPVASYPYNVQPSAFARVQIASTNATISNGQEAEFTVSQRSKPTRADAPLAIISPSVDTDAAYARDTAYNSDTVFAYGITGEW